MAQDKLNMPYDYSRHQGYVINNGSMMWNEDWRSGFFFFDGTFANYPSTFGTQIDSNYFFPDVPNARATHTPTLLHIVAADKMFEPKIDNKHTDYIWSDSLPDELLKQTTWL